MWFYYPMFCSVGMQNVFVYVLAKKILHLGYFYSKGFRPATRINVFSNHQTHLYKSYCIKLPHVFIYVIIYHVYEYVGHDLNFKKSC
jgi:hypothetical protein